MSAALQIFCVGALIATIGTIGAMLSGNVIAMLLAGFGWMAFAVFFISDEENKAGVTR